MDFFGSCPSAFRWLTNLSIQNLRFNNSDMPNLLNACDQLRFLCMSSCDSGLQSVLKIDAPHSQLMELVFDICSCVRVELIQVPKLVRVVCDTGVLESAPIVFCHVPLLRDISLTWSVMNELSPFLLSNWLSSVTSLSTLTLDFEDWIKPEDPKRLSRIFNKLRDLYLSDVFAECNLEWTLYLLEAAPSLKNFFLKVQRHKCTRNIYEGINRTNLQWKALSNFKHHILNLLDIVGFEVDYKLMTYIRRVMDRAVQLKMIRLQHKEPCDDCDAQGPLGSNFPRNEIHTDLTREILAHGFSSAIEIIVV
ncbi:hypothetical protein BAE44_0026161 [Dichanthelium oligosanthes]|uniref:At1g61320/AtMIF1 LRR domain-containing protein n=1 Tax=Dichanthelium oligosanthes TaxID=888268 RepID=A0A1E5UIV9_9POAL|nr:hypothetical protein BAE44_0026161 [Dichanthelium oligosanthes]